MNKTSRVVSFSAVIVFFILAPKWARPASLPECTTDCRDASNIIRSAPCGVYGEVNSRQTVGATGTVLDIAVDCHATDIVTVLLEVSELYHASHLDVFLAGTSRGALSVVGQNSLGIGSLLSSPVNSINGGLWVGVDSPEARLRPSFVVVPVHVLAHAQDGCSVSTAANSKKLQEDFHAAGVQAFFLQRQWRFRNRSGSVRSQGFSRIPRN